MEPIFGGLLQIGVDGQLQPSAFDRLLRTNFVELAAEAVDDDEAIAIGAHQILVEGLLDARLSDDGAGLHALVFRSRQL